MTENEEEVAAAEAEEAEDDDEEEGPEAAACWPGRRAAGMLRKRSRKTFIAVWYTPLKSSGVAAWFINWCVALAVVNP
jgi:hypothetical protein